MFELLTQERLQKYPCPACKGRGEIPGPTGHSSIPGLVGMTNHRCSLCAIRDMKLLHHKRTTGKDIVKFRYRALCPDGSVEIDTIEAESRDKAFRKLRDRDVFPTKIFLWNKEEKTPMAANEKRTDCYFVVIHQEGHEPLMRQFFDDEEMDTWLREYRNSDRAFDTIDVFEAKLSYEIVPASSK